MTKDSTITDKHARSVAYLERLERHVEIRPVYVALADKIYNLKDMIQNYSIHGPEMWKYFSGHVDEHLWWYASVLEIGQRRVSGCKLNEYLAELIELFRRDVVGGGVAPQPDDKYVNVV